jgi:hypothetical protein
VKCPRKSPDLSAAGLSSSCHETATLASWASTHTE